MTQEEKQLLLKDLCARLPYGVKVYGNYRYDDGEKIVDDKKIKVLDLSALDWFVNGIDIKPYLRSMESMTKDEEIEWFEDVVPTLNPDKQIDFFNKYHFDYRGLIPMGLALPAKEGMYNGKEQ